MKKYLLGILILFCTTVSAETYFYQAYQFAEKDTTGTWTDWLPSKVQMSINHDSGEITIYSPRIQHYQLANLMPESEDTSGKQYKYYAINLDDNNYVYIRFRTENNGNNQIYVDFSDGSIVYNIVRINKSEFLEEKPLTSNL